eukprot:TRINITY_DN17880_c0_g1_i1.p1 TRINITY_DN17880_c0_g1~~TRINITY_DN17880_c0_g1_i1.p1  ORF type:complete len:349 (-),score=75.66 TRINITY_DN17880_c0_g1_i1:42-1088(-)
MEESHPLQLTFKEYHSINPLKSAGKLVKQFPPDSRWVVLEKVHGSNFSFLCDGQQMKYARRTDMLDPAETFFGWQEIQKYNSSIMDMFRTVQDKHPQVKKITVFGELFGGIYPHPDVKDLGKQPLQRGVYYTPTVEFYAFDVLAFPETDAPFWLDYDEVLSLFQKHNLFHAQPLMEGTLEECFKFNIQANSTIPNLLGLPPLAKNQMEGVIIKAIDGQLRLKGKTNRAIFKFKNANFEEVNPPANLTIHETIRDEKVRAVEQTYNEIERYLTENRIHTLESKMGLITFDNLNQATVLYQEDALKDFERDSPELWGRIEPRVQEVIRNNTASKVRTLLSEYVRNQGATA